MTLAAESVDAVKPADHPVRRGLGAALTVDRLPPAALLAADTGRKHGSSFLGPVCRPPVPADDVPAVRCRQPCLRLTLPSACTPARSLVFGPGAVLKGTSPTPCFRPYRRSAADGYT